MGLRQTILITIGAALWAVAAPAAAQDAAPAAFSPGEAGQAVRSNLWLSEALLAEVVSEAASSLGPAPAAVRLTAKDTGPENDLMRSVATRVLGGLGYELYVADDDPAHEGAVDYTFYYQVLGIELKYPEVDRTLGIWRHWVARQLAVTVRVEITEADSGRLLLSDRLERSYDDRVPNGDFDAVNSDLYAFTSARVGESGWKSRLEEIVVLGTLAGLVAVYFANTSN